MSLGIDCYPVENVSRQAAILRPLLKIGKAQSVVFRPLASITVAEGVIFGDLALM